MIMKKEKALYATDKDGKLVSREVKLEVTEDSLEYENYKDDTIEIIPMPRLKLRELFDNVSKIDEKLGSKDRDDKYDEVFNHRIILEYCVNPKYTSEELKVMKPVMIGILVNTVLRESGLGNSKPKLKDGKE